MAARDLDRDASSLRGTRAYVMHALRGTRFLGTRSECCPEQAMTSLLVAGDKASNVVALRG
jgi:hypothetical protein